MQRAPSFETPITVLLAEVGDNETVLVQFSDDVTVIAPTVPAFEVFFDGAWHSPDSVVQDGLDGLDWLYFGGNVVDGTPWRILSIPYGVADAGRIVVPQTGLVVP